MNNQDIDRKAAQLVAPVQVRTESRANWRKMAIELVEKAKLALDASWTALNKDVLFVSVVYALAEKLGEKPDPWMNVVVDGKPIDRLTCLCCCRDVELYATPEEYSSGVQYMVAGIDLSRDLFMKVFVSDYKTLYFETIEETAAKGFTGSQKRYEVHHAGHRQDADAWKETTSYGAFTGGSGKTISYKFIRGE